MIPAAVEGELDSHLKKQTEAELRAERVEAEARGSMEKGCEFDPYHFDNLFEAFQQATPAQQKLIAATLGTAIQDGKLNNEHANHLALLTIKNVVEEYTLKTAMFVAEKRVE